MADYWTTALFLIIGIALGMGLAMYLKMRNRP